MSKYIIVLIVLTVFTLNVKSQIYTEIGSGYAFSTQKSKIVFNDNNSEFSKYSNVFSGVFYKGLLGFKFKRNIFLEIECEYNPNPTLKNILNNPNTIIVSDRTSFYKGSFLTIIPRVTYQLKIKNFIASAGIGISTNIINSIARHEEEYHKKILAKMGKPSDAASVRTIHEDVKSIDPELKSEFCYDNYIRGFLVDRFMDKSGAIEDFIDCKSEELGDFVNAGYKAKKEKDKVVLMRQGKVSGKAISITKEIKLKGKKQIEIAYSLKNLSKGSIDTVFGVEFNITMPYLNSDRYNYFAGDKILNNLNEKGPVSETDSFSIKDSGKELDIGFTFSKKPESTWYFPVKTVSQSERAYELNYQASCILPRWNFKIPSGKQFSFKISIQTSNQTASQL